jgi:hypothetical protein
MGRRTLLAALIVCGATVALAQSPAPPQLTTPDKVETSVGTFQFNDGVPTQETVDRVYDYLDRSRAVQSFMNGFSGVSVAEIHKGLLDVSVADNDVLLFSKLMDSKSLFLTANCDTLYFVSVLDLSKGPMIVEIPSDTIGTFDDAWFRWVADLGLPGPDRGRGGAYILVPPGYTGLLPEGGYFVARSRTNKVLLFGRAFLENNDPAPVAARIRNTYKAYAYKPGGYGSSIAAFLAGQGPLGPLTDPPPTRFIEGSGKVMNTIPPNDASYFDMLNTLVQDEPAEALDPELGGQFAAIGIVKGKAFAPDDRMRKILADGAVLGNAASRTVGIGARPSEGFVFYSDTKSSWSNPLFVGGSEFMNPPAEITKEGVRPFPNTGARTLDARASFFYLATVVTPAMVMRLTDIGSQYLGTFYDADGQPFDGSKTYQITLPPNIPAAKFWSLTLYDNQTRSMLDTPQLFPRAGSQSYPTPAAVPNEDGSTTITFAPKRPEGVKNGNWIETNPGRGWFVLLRLYSPLKPFFDKTWRPGEIEAVK